MNGEKDISACDAEMSFMKIWMIQTESQNNDFSQQVGGNTK